jgi:hypothetical protein
MYSLDRCQVKRSVVPHHGLISWVMWYYSCNGLLISGWIAIGPAIPSTAFINIFILYPIGPEDLINNSHVHASISSESSNSRARNRSLAHGYYPLQKEIVDYRPLQKIIFLGL